MNVNDLLRKLPRNQFGQRWSIGATMTLVNSDGDVYLFRRRLIQTPWAAIYLHDIEREDEDPAGHSHPFPFASIILRGGYTEHVLHLDGPNLVSEEWRVHKRGGVNLFRRGETRVHSIRSAAPRTKTLVFAGPRKDSWGWFVEGVGIVPWKEYLLSKGQDYDRSRIVGPSSTKETP